jgi:anti-anti-sigma factor
MRLKVKRRSPSCVDFEVRVVCGLGRRPTVVVRGELDRATVHKLTAALGVAMTGNPCIEVDLTEATFMDTSGVRALVDAYLRLGQLPEAILIRDPSPAVRELLALAGVDQLFDIVCSARA